MCRCSKKLYMFPKKVLARDAQSPAISAGEPAHFLGGLKGRGGLAAVRPAVGSAGHYFRAGCVVASEASNCSEVAVRAGSESEARRASTGERRSREPATSRTVFRWTERGRPVAVTRAVARSKTAGERAVQPRANASVTSDDADCLPAGRRPVVVSATPIHGLCGEWRYVAERPRPGGGFLPHRR